ncbi:hypothetical protein GN956_G14326 [Arapaima gigas]
MKISSAVDHVGGTAVFQHLSSSAVGLNADWGVALVFYLCPNRFEVSWFRRKLLACLGNKGQRASEGFWGTSRTICCIKEASVSFEELRST